MRDLPTGFATALAALVVVSLTVAAPPAEGSPKKIDCHKDLKKARELIDDMWSFKVFKPGYVDLDAVYAELAPEAKRAKTPEACADVLARFMAKLGDGHSHLAYFPDLERTRPKITIRSQRERLAKLPGALPTVHAYVVSRDTTDESLRPVLPGSEILAVDGTPVDSLYTFLNKRAAGSTQQWKDYLCDSRLLLGPPDTDVELTIREPGGAKKTVTVHRPPYPSEKERKREGEIYRDTARVVTWKILDGGWGYLKYESFSYPGYEENLKLFDAALDSLIDTPGLIIDLRGNGGGIVGVMTGTAGRFVTEKVALEYFQVRHPGQTAVIPVWDPFSGSYTVRPPWVAKPRGKTYTGPVVILIDRRCFSACEGFSAGLQAIERALVIGETSGGGSGAVSGLRLPSGAIITFSFTVGWRPDGAQVEGQGVTPDIKVRERARDWAAGRDRVLERAVKALKRGEAKPLVVAEQGS